MNYLTIDPIEKLKDKKNCKMHFNLTFNVVV